MKRLQELSDYTGRATEMVTYTLAAHPDVPRAIKKLQDEVRSSSNIKDKTTRSHVHDALS